MEDLFDFQALWVIQPGHVQPDRAKYQIFGPDRQLLASAAETQRRSRLAIIDRPMPNSKVLEIVTAQGDPLLTMLRQHTEWITEILDPSGVVVGRIRTGGSRRHYSLLDETGQTIGKVVGDLGLKKFAVTDASGGGLANVRKTRAGLFKEMLTSNDHYKVEFVGPVPRHARTLIAMVPIVLDLTLYEPS
ncbi:MAG: phospholipid scramblase-related protein [Trebonia sp.]